MPGLQLRCKTLPGLSGKQILQDSALQEQANPGDVPDVVGDDVTVRVGVVVGDAVI